MTDYDKIVCERQQAIRRRMDKGHIHPTTVQHDGGWENITTVLSWFPADPKKKPAVMSVANLYRLLHTKALPAELLSTLLPAGFVIVSVPEGIDYDEFSAGCREFIDAKDRAHHPESEDGRDLGPSERDELDSKIVRLRA